MRAKNLINSILVLFILVSIPATVLIARNANIGSKADTLTLSVAVTPKSQEIVRGGSRSFQLDLSVPDRDVKSSVPVLLKFAELPTGISLNPQPLGATLSNHYQKNHIFNVVVDRKTAVGTYEIEVVVSDLKTQQKTSFSVVVK
jgi:hypothetical protein